MEIKERKKKRAKKRLQYKKTSLTKQIVLIKEFAENERFKVHFSGASVVVVSCYYMK